MTVREERTFRGISKRLAIRYLERLGGEKTEEGVVEGDRWRAECSESTVSVGPSLTLTEVTILFEGEEATLDELLSKFRRKAMRAGG